MTIEARERFLYSSRKKLYPLVSDRIASAIEHTIVEGHSLITAESQIRSTLAVMHKASVGVQYKLVYTEDSVTYTFPDPVFQQALYYYLSGYYTFDGLSYMVGGNARPTANGFVGTRTITTLTFSDGIDKGFPSLSVTSALLSDGHVGVTSFSLSLVQPTPPQRMR